MYQMYKILNVLNARLNFLTHIIGVNGTYPQTASDADNVLRKNQGKGILTI